MADQKAEGRMLRLWCKQLCCECCRKVKLGLQSIYWILYCCSSVLKLTATKPILGISFQLCLVIDTLVVWNWPWCEYLHHGTWKHYKLVCLFLEKWLLNRYQQATGVVTPFVIKWRRKMAFSALWSHQKVFRTFFTEMNYLQRNELSFWTFFEVDFYPFHRTF